MKSFHLFYGEGGDDKPAGMEGYRGSFESLEEAKAAVPLDKHGEATFSDGGSYPMKIDWAQVVDAQPDGSLVVVLCGYPYEVGYRQLTFAWRKPDEPEITYHYELRKRQDAARLPG